MVAAGNGTIIFTNASAAFKGFPLSGAFAMACHAKAGLAQSLARELGPQVRFGPIYLAVRNIFFSFYLFSYFNGFCLLWKT